ncbi:MAG: alpha/beta hydrolase family protein [Bacteroidales bacterium]
MKQLILRSVNKGADTLKSIFTVSLVLLVTAGSIRAQEDFDVVRNEWLQYSDAPNSLYHHLTGQAYELLESREERIKGLQTEDEWRQRQKEVRSTMWEILGSFEEKTPLNARLIDKVQKGAYRVENIVYESHPGFYVTASLFIPEDIDKPAPGILFCSGHSTRAYRREYYQLPLLNLVKKGFVVLAIDPIGQGERLQYYNSVTGESMIGGSTDEHSYPSAQVFLTGNSIARYFLWDGIRGIDYLVSRPEVDPDWIGVHGLSGGGTQTAYISAMDERVVASAPAGYITSYRRLMESIGVQDGEQNFYHGISSGIDHPDFIQVRAPKPTLIMATTRDFFSIQGARETYARAKRVYDIFGKHGNLKMVEDDHGHGYTQKTREAMYGFFQDHLQLPGSSVEEEVEFLTSQELQKTSTGQLSTSLDGETVFSLNRREAAEQIKVLQASREDLANHLQGVIKSAKKLSGYKEPSGTEEPVFTGRYQREGYAVEKYFVKGEGDYIIPYLLMIPERPNNKAVIYLHPSGKSAEASAEGEMEWFVRNGFTVLAPDMIGVGEMGQGDFRGDAYIGHISYNIGFTSMLIGRSITGIQAGDVVRLTRLLENNTAITDIYGFARKEMSPVLLHAAAFDSRITRIALIEPYVSYRSIVMDRFYNPAFVHSLVPGALQSYDLPDLAASLAPRKLLMGGVMDGLGSPADPEAIAGDLDIIKAGYQHKDAFDQLDVTFRFGESFEKPYKPYDYYREWIK